MPVFLQALLQSKFGQFIVKWIGLPLAKKLLTDLWNWTVKKYGEWKIRREIRRKLKEDLKRMGDARTSDEIRDAHINRDHF